MAREHDQDAQRANAAEPESPSGEGSHKGAHRANADEPNRGRDAELPRDIPKSGWRDVAVRVKDQVSEDNVSLIAAGLALYALLAIFPALAAAVSVYGLIASPDQVASQIEAMRGVLPAEASEIIGGQMEALAEQGGGALGFGLLVGLVLSLWSARQGMTALITATNIAYNEREERSFLKQLLVSLVFTVGAVVAFVLVLMLAVVTPVMMRAIGIGAVFEEVVGILRWVVLWLLVVAALSIVYRYAPDRDKPEWRWVGWGAAIAASLWLIGSLLFSLYLQNFDAYGATYGTLGGVIILLMWFYLSGFVVVLGAEINSELERQTHRDTTAGKPQRMGRRGAQAADTVGRSSRQA